MACQRVGAARIRSSSIASSHSAPAGTTRTERPEHVSTAEIRADNRLWHNTATDQQRHTTGGTDRRQLLATQAGACMMRTDVALVTGAFMLAYVARFSVDERLPALGLEQYVRMATVQALLTHVLLVTHGLYELERPRSWPVRLRGIVSASSTALVLAVTVSYFLGDQAFSRLWLASGWAASVIALSIWGAVAQRVYETIRGALAPSNRVLIVGANRLGRQLADELKG